jgi:Ca-activated chloride channel family protein
MPGRRGILSALATVSVAVAALAAGPQQPAQDGQPPVFRGGAESVAVYATVLNRYGEMVVNLRRDDFVVEDDGSPQPLTVFVNGLQPITATILMDRSASMTLNLDLARNAAEQFVVRMLPGDRASVGTFSNRVDLGTDYTGDRDALLEGLNGSLHYGNPTKLWDALDETITAMAPLTGRRVILLMTDGIDTLSTRTVSDVLARARNEELMIYAVQFGTNWRAYEAELQLAPTLGQVLSSSARRPAATDGLRRLKRQTGGGHFLLNQYDDINTTFTHVMQELHYQYVLGFTPRRLDGRLHDLRVKVNRPGVTVRARQSYRAPRPAGAAQP